MQIIKSHKTFGGRTSFWVHESHETSTPMRFATFVPASKSIKSCVVWLSGLTCTEENFMAKSGVQRLLAASNTMVIAPDTSPRGLSLPGEHETYDFGSGAGFYVDAKVSAYSKNYRMFSYIVQEICPIARDFFGATELSIMGHSMGGHGALVIGLRHPELFKRIVAFAPIVHPSGVPWGKKALTGYLGPRDLNDNSQEWASYDACELLRQGYRHPTPIVLYQGTKDEFLDRELKPEVFDTLAREVGQKCDLKWCEDYDHSYYFIASHLGEVLP